ncbi:hypothetical protein HY450_01280 [Candidatus Pacearchaeota archaeon]|nr:hypothetical protein [Candidatus Pacearchaeota archaeon]
MNNKELLGRFGRARRYVIENEVELRMRYGEQFIAVYTERGSDEVNVVGSGSDEGGLYEEIYHKYPDDDYKRKVIFVLINTIEDIVRFTTEDIPTLFEDGEL